MTDEELAKDLGPLAALTIGVGTMIGAGIFVLPREAYATAGPAIALSFVVGGIISLFTALSASELGTAMPKAGGSYYYVNHALGPLFGSIAGMGNWMGLAFASAFYMIGFGDFLVKLVGVPALSLGFFTLSSVQVAAILAGLLFIGVNYVGAKETGAIQVVIVVTLVLILTAFSILGFLQADLTTLRPFAPSELGGYGAILPGTALVFVSFLGFAKITTVAEEIKNPGRNLPLAVVGSVLIVTTMYAILMVVMASVKPWQELSAIGADPVIEVAELSFEAALGLGGVGFAIIVFGGLLATASSANASILASSRINFAMGRDKLVTTWLNEIHPRFATPYRSIAVTGSIIVFLIAIGDIKTLAKAGSALHLIVYGLLNLALIVMRESEVAEYDPAFTVPLYPLTPILGAVFSFGLLAFLAPIEIALSVLFVAFGIVWYLVYARGRTEKVGILSRYILRRSDELPDAAVSAASSVQPDGGFRVLVPLSNPESQRDLVQLAGSLAKNRGGTLVGVHIVQVPDQTALASAKAEYDFSEADQLLESARLSAQELDVPFETHTVLSHRSFEEVFDAAETYNADLMVMGWGPTHGSPGRAESALDEITSSLPYDVLVLKDRGFDPSDILVPTAGGPDSDLSASIAHAFREVYDSNVTLLHVADDVQAGESFLSEWAAERDLADARLAVESGDVEHIIESYAEDSSLVIIGATERGLLSRLLSGTLVMDVVDDVSCSVLLAEQTRTRKLSERLFG
ncbi:amino acid permease [Haloferax sp. DFSO60]|uniref:amino acid permease n=1 Tax=Haloferax sp. DFSO60 TaxID=3388652 RepID=UPI00397BEB9A